MSACSGFVLSTIVFVALSCTGEALANPAIDDSALRARQTKLDNGLTVLTLEDHTTPVVAFQMWVRVGSSDEARVTGLAHLFEHMMFKGSKNVEPDSHTSIISSVGGRSNAYTTEDTTVFWQTLPAQHLPLALWLEADRMATLRVDDVAFRREREVVKEERRLRIESQPYGRLSEIIYDHAFVVHPYKHPTIGSMADLEAASIADVRDFHSTYYVPENATVTVVGDFDSAEALQLVTQYLGRVPKAARPVPRDIPKEPQMTGERRAVVEEAWPLPAVVVAYHITYDGHPDSYPLHIMSKILSDGQSARLSRELIYNRRLCLTAFGSGNITEHPNLFFAVCVVQPGQSPEAAEAALIGEFEKLKDEGVTVQEVQRAQNQFARDYILSRESNEEKARHLAHAAVIHSDITTADSEFDIFVKIVPADVQRVARIYFNESNRVVLHVLPKGSLQ